MIPPNATAEAPRVLFLADGGPEIGGGHAMRCLTLAGALADGGAACAFVAHPGVAQILETFAAPSIEILVAPGEGSAAMLAAAAGLAEQWNAGVVVLDSYRLAETDRSWLGNADRRIVVIDDLADRKHDCDLLVDPTFARAADAYRDLVPAACQVLSGPDYALVRPEFSNARAAVLVRRSGQVSVERVLVALGLTDIGGITGRVVQALAPVVGSVRLDVVVGQTAPSLAVLEALATENLHLHVETREMALLTAAADIAIGAGGSSVWERACLGLPSITLVLADNQRPMTLALEQAGALIAVDARRADKGETVAAACSRLIHDGALRSRLTAASSSICDGLGAGRVASAILACVGVV